QHGQNRSSDGPLLRRANCPLPHPFRHRQRHHASRAHPRLRHPQKSRCARQPRPRQAPRRKSQSHHSGRRRSHFRQAQRALSTSYLANRQRHSDQHERQRGHFQPRHPDRSGRNGQQNPHSSERRRQHVAIFQRHFPRRHAHCRGHGNLAAPASRCKTPSRRPRHKGQGIHQCRQNRPHSS